MRQFCAELLLAENQSTLFVYHHHYDYRAAYLEPHRIRKSLKSSENDKKGIRPDHPGIVIKDYWIFTQNDKTAYLGKFNQNK